MRFVLGCLTSAVLAAALTIFFTAPHRGDELAAQDKPRPGPRLQPPNQPTPVEPTPAERVPVKPPARGISPDGPIIPESLPTLDDSTGKEPTPVGPVKPIKKEPYQEPRVRAESFDDDGLTPEERVNVAVYDKVNRAVVHIMTKGSRPEGFFNIDVPTEGAGSGSVIDMSGHIVTNLHVVEDARQVNVTLFDGKSYDAKFVGSDAVNDVAVIRIDAPAESLHPVEFGNSRRLKVGMRVFAIGNPFGLERTLTTGIISSLNRSLQLHGARSIKQIIQIDAAINPGNSGGPLLDSHGRLIGINTAIASKTGQSAGVGFAIPISLVSRIVPQLIEHGKVIRPEIGISRVFEVEQGLLIAKLQPGGPADRAGLRGPQAVVQQRGPFRVESIDRSAADLIVGIDDQKVATGDDLLGYIEDLQPGTTVTLTVVRQSKTIKVPVTLTSSAER